MVLMHDCLVRLETLFSACPPQYDVIIMSPNMVTTRDVLFIVVRHLEDPSSPMQTVLRWFHGIAAINCTLHSRRLEYLGFFRVKTHLARSRVACCMSVLSASHSMSSSSGLLDLRVTAVVVADPITAND